MHSRVNLHQVAFLAESTTAFIDHCRAIGVGQTTLVTPVLMQPGGIEEAKLALAPGGVAAHCVNHPFASYPDLEKDRGEAAAKLTEAIGIAAALGAASIYVLTGGRGSLEWEAAAARFADLIAPCIGVAQASGIRLLVENANAFNADLHIAHTLPDAITLAETAGIGLCIELHACWMEAGLKPLFRRAMPITGLVQVSDYVLGDRSTPCRAVPGDGAIPLERLIGDLLEAGYEGVFDLELVGPRIQKEGAATATKRAAENLSEILTKLGA
jgi:sugar phosphate isomerase/epimerase